MPVTLMLSSVLLVFTVGYMAISGKPNAALILCAVVQLFWLVIASRNTSVGDHGKPENHSGEVISQKCGFVLMLHDGAYSIINRDGHCMTYDDPQTAMCHWAKTKPLAEPTP